jgi:hypothetical protein
MTPFTGPESENEITIIGDGDESKSAKGGVAPLGVIGIPDR